MTTQTNIRQYATKSSLIAFIAAIFWGLGAGAMFALNVPVLIVLSLAAVLLIVRHAPTDWIIYLVGVIIGWLLFKYAGVVLPDIVPWLVVIFGARFF